MPGLTGFWEHPGTPGRCDAPAGLAGSPQKARDAAAGVLDEAYERLHHTGPEWGGNLANHGPMAAEVLARRDRPDQVPAWVDGYIGRLDELPAPGEPVTDDNWRAALGDRVGDWVVYLTRQVAERPWRDVLAAWWPRLLPGIAAGAAHGVIRTGHAVRTLLAGDETPAATRRGRPARHRRRGIRTVR
jgi:hypothetical protein